MQRHKRLASLALAVVATAGTATALSGCYGSYYTTDGYGYYDGGGYGPELAYVAPGVQVVADSPYPLFYTGGNYWRYYNNGWYSSPYYNRGWAYATPPYALSYNVHNPNAYVRYRPYGYTSRTVYRDGNYNRGYYNRGYYDRGYQSRTYDRNYQGSRHYDRSYQGSRNYDRGYQGSRNYNRGYQSRSYDRGGSRSYHGPSSSGHRGGGTHMQRPSPSARR